MKNIGPPHIFIIGALLGTIAFLLWLFSPKQIASASEITDTYGEVLGGILGVAGAFGVALFTLHSERRQRRARVAIGVAEVLHRLRDEMAEKLDWSLTYGLGTGLMSPSPASLADLEAWIRRSDATEHGRLKDSINETFARTPENLRIDEHSGNIEDLSIEIYEKIIALREEVKAHDKRKINYHSNLGALTLTLFTDNVCDHIKNTVKIINESENIIELLKQKHNNQLREAKKLRISRFRPLIQSATKEI